ncbi:sensor histidine kinase [Stenotrophomonas maltophilia]|uniref:ATP-binding protein n=1 Tax=Stenotrophomonas maltophilia TaxID=40324 RepID=UPI002E75AE1F|nr:ATP-binding protein [Stenotrophomonas maltophilia]MCU1152204.1 sensor histidine kinase [Stenotrophomonas maltophilia]
MALLASELKRFRTSKPETRFRAENHAESTYAAHMGFFQAFGLEHGNRPGEAQGSGNYLPLTYLNVEEIRQQAAQSYEPVGEFLDRESGRLAHVLTRLHEGQLVDTLTYSLREILRNAVEHSQSEKLAYCAQYWPTRHRVEIAVLDTGMGVRASLAANPYIEVDSDRTALQLSLMPSISGKMYRGVRRRPGDHWQNSGYGLYMTSRLCRNGGSFFIASGQSGVLLTPGQKTDFACNLPGTALRLVMDTNLTLSLQDRLGQFRSEGYAVAQRFSGEHAISPSSASTMLARDFAGE